ncbi:lactate utilization protein LutB domain-containing protein, partial [Kitasatospora sp. NPDC001574]
SSAELTDWIAYERITGPIGPERGDVLHGILTPQLRGVTTELDASLPYASSLCGACYEVCPVAIDIPEVLVHLRERVTDRPGHRLERAAVAAATYVLDRPALLRAAERAAARTRRFHPRRLPGPGRAWTDTRELPAVPPEPFRDWWRRNRT